MLGVQPIRSSELLFLTPEEEPPILNSIDYQNNSIVCYFNPPTEEFSLKYNEQKCSSLQDLKGIIPTLEEHPIILAQILNFFISKNAHQLIINPDDYIKKYDELYRFSDLSAYNHYDTSLISIPFFKQQELIYFVEKNGMPYKVSCQWPILSSQPEIKYEILNSID